ncbi:MAG: tetratricopeptide repeat protein [Pseudomonadota bacterium]
MPLRWIMIAAGAALAAGCVTGPAPETVVGDYLSARLAAKAHNIEDAAEAFAAAHARAPGSTEIRRNAFYFALASGRIAEALPLAETLAADPNADDGGFSAGALAVAAVKEARYGDARLLIEKAVEEGFPRTAGNLINVWAIAGGSGEAAALEKLRQAPGDEFRGFYPLHAALLSENLGAYDEARSAYELSLLAFSGSAEIVAYGAFLERQGDPEQALEFYQLLAAQDGFGRFAGRDGLDRLETGAPAPAFRETTPARGAAIALYSLASGILQDVWQRREAAERAGFRIGDADYNLSLAMARLALYLDPSLDDAWRFVGSILNHYGEHESAIAALGNVSPASPFYEQARIEIAAARDSMGDSEGALAMLRAFINANPAAVDARLAYAALFARRGEHEQAVKAMDGLIAMLPEEPAPIAWRYYLTRAASLLEIDEWPRAEADLQRAAEIAPEEATVLNYLGYSWAERGENLEEAFALIEKAVVLEPTSGAIIDSLGWAHYQLGEYDEAVGHLEQAASLEPGDPVITDHLGDVYWRLGRETEARYQWERVLQLEPNDDLADLVREKLEEGLAPAEPVVSEP